MSVFAVPRSTAMALAGKNEPDLKKGQRINCQLARSAASVLRRTAREGRCGRDERTRRKLAGGKEAGKPLGRQHFPDYREERTDNAQGETRMESKERRAKGTSLRPSPLALLFASSRCPFAPRYLCLAVKASREVRVPETFVVRNRQVHIRPVR